MVLLCTAFACGGTAPSSEQPATAAVAAYLRTLDSDNPRTAYRLLSSKAQKRTSEKQFTEQWRRSQRERAAQASALRAGLSAAQGLRERARVRYRDGKRIGLTRDDREWRLSGALASLHHAGAPRDIVHLFAQALLTNNLGELLSTLTERRRETVSAELSQLVESLATHVDDAIFPIGKDRAELSWEHKDTHYKLVLRREQGEWRVDDLHIRELDSSK